MEREAINVGDIILYRSALNKKRAEMAVVTGINPENGWLARESVPGVGSLIFEGATFAGSADPDIVMKLECRHCALRGGCMDYLANNRVKLCREFFERIKEQNLDWLVEDLPR